MVMHMMLCSSFSDSNTRGVTGTARTRKGGGEHERVGPRTGAHGSGVRVATGGSAQGRVRSVVAWIILNERARGSDREKMKREFVTVNFQWLHQRPPKITLIFDDCVRGRRK
jgi:hypothetical protein